MKGATPVPGPIITMGWSGSVGRWNEFLRRQKIGTCMSVCTQAFLSSHAIFNTTDKFVS